MYASQWRAYRICRFAMSCAPAWWLDTSDVHDAAPGSQFTSGCPVSPSMLVRAAASSGAKIFPAYLTRHWPRLRSACHGHMPASACTHKGVHELTHGSSRHLLARLAHDRWHEVSSPWQQLWQHLPAGSTSELGAPGHALPQALDRVSEGKAHVIASERAQHEDSAERCYAACQRSASDDGQDHLRPR